jgi:hypothetical protein
MYYYCSQTKRPETLLLASALCRYYRYSASAIGSKNVATKPLYHVALFHLPYFEDMKIIIARQVGIYFIHLLKPNGTYMFRLLSHK